MVLPLLLNAAQYPGILGGIIEEFRSETVETGLLWIIIGCSGQAIFGCRFLVQWIASEKAGRSYIPVVFWHLSLAGSLLLLAYAIKRRDPVFFIGFSLNSVVYVRNLMLIEKERRKSGSPAGAGEEDAR